MSSSPKPPTPVNPQTVINAETAANRINRITPFGSQTYDGNSLTTTLPQGTQNAFNNISAMAGNQQQLLTNPSSGLQDALLQKVSQRYTQPQQKSSQMSPPPIN